MIEPHPDGRTLLIEPRLRRRLGQVVLGCAVLYSTLLVLAVMRSDMMDDLDRSFGREPQDLTEDNDRAAAVWRFIGDMTGPHQMTVVTVVVALVLFLKDRPRAAVLTFVTMASTEYLTRGFKLLVERQRPVWNEPVEIANGYSFPSGHSSGIAAAAGVAIVLSLLLVRSRTARRAICLMAVATALVVGADRVFLGVHNISDVIAGFALGGLVLGATLLALSRPEKTVPSRAAA